MQTPKKSTSSREMHKYVWMLLGVFALIAATYPTAMMRVSQKENLHGYHVHSWTIEGKAEESSIK